MGKYRAGPKPWEKNDPEGRRLDPGQYPELNATFYTAGPAEFINVRINVLSLMACSDEQLAPAFGSDRQIGTVSFGGISPPSEEERQRFFQTEAMMLVHHASEALLHLSFAHVEHPERPWLGMA